MVGVRGRRAGLVAALLLALVCGGRSQAAAPDAVPSLLEAPAVAADGSGGLSSPATRRALRSRRVEARTEVLVKGDGSPRLGVGQRVGLRLFDDASVVATITDVTRHASFGQTWTGRLDGGDDGHAILSMSHGAIVGTVTLPGAVYRIGYAPDGTQVVDELDPSALPREDDPIPPGSAVADAEASTGEAADTGSQIDVMVLYTASARVAAGGTAAVRAEATLAVASANQAYTNNGLAQRVRLVFAGEIAITESGNIQTDLSTLRNHPTVAWLRDANRADLVSLLTSGAVSSCGVGYLMDVNSTTFAPFGFSVVERVCASTGLSFPHELGHNMGAHHDPFVLSPGDGGLFSYSHGYVDLTGKFRTIMSYPDQCVAAGVSCPRIPYFSSPSQTFNGRSIGTASVSDNARTLGQTANTVSNYRQALTPPLTLSLGVSQVSFTVGQTLVTSGTVANPGGAMSADFYVGILFPNGTVVCFTPVTPANPAGYAMASVNTLASFRPLAAGHALGAPFSVTVPSFFSYQWTGTEAPGGFVFFMLVVRAGGLTAGLTSSQMLGVTMAPFSFSF